MRKWITLVEEQQQEELYHGTNLEGMIGIIASDSLNEDGWDGDNPGASFTTDYGIGRGFAVGNSKDRARGISWDWEHGAEKPKMAHSLDELEAMIDPALGCGGAVMVFDRTVLAQSHRLQDYNYTETSKEFEVRSMTDKEGLATGPVVHALKRIDILNHDAAHLFFEMMPTTMVGYEKYRIEYEKAIQIARRKAGL